MHGSSGNDERTSRSDIAWILAGRTWIHGRLEPVEIAIDDRGWIHSVGKVRSGAPRHDVGDSVILPAATDLHVHFRDPGGPKEAETLASGTGAAALGGVTLVGDMPNNPEPIDSPERLREKARRVPGRAAVDVLLYASPTRAPMVPRLARLAGGFKVYMSPTTGIPDVAEPAGVTETLTRLAEFDLPVSVHAEDPSRFRGADAPQTPAEWNLHRPAEAEARAIERLLSAPPRLRLHVAHVTTAKSVERLRSAGASFEVTPHHLLLSERSGTSPRFKVNPPLRSEEERRALWDAFRQGLIPCVASDHAPHSVESKDVPFDRAPSGMPGVETMLPLLLAKVRTGELHLGALLAAACDRPARWLGQPLGRVAPGHRANLLIVDFTVHRPVSARILSTACGWTAFEGWDAVFPREHFRDGKRIVDAGELVGTPDGHVVRPEFAGPIGSPSA